MANKFESEVALFRQKLQVRVRPDIPGYDKLFQRTMARLNEVPYSVPPHLPKLNPPKVHLIALSNRGVPAWLILQPIWRLVLAKSLPPLNKKYKSVETWKRLANDLEELSRRLKETPMLTGLDEIPDTNKLILELTEWTRRLRNSPFVDEQKSIFCTPMPNGRYSVHPGENRKQGRGKRPPPADEEPDLVAWTLVHCVRTLTGKPHWNSVAGVVYGFLCPWLIQVADDQGQTLQKNVRDYQRHHGRFLESRANHILSSALIWHSDISNEELTQIYLKYGSLPVLDWAAALNAALAVNDL